MTYETESDLRAGIRRELREAFPGLEVMELRRLEGGHSGLTYWTTVGGDRVVVKAVPPGRRPVGRHDVARQAQVLDHLAGTPVPVPSVVSRGVSGQAWFAMSWLEGEAVEPVLDGVRLPDALVRGRAFDAVDALAALHAVDPTGLAAPGETAGDIAGDPADDVRHWTDVLRAGAPEFVATGDELSRQLLATAPGPVAAVLVHGDFRLGNVMFQGRRLEGIVDWEIWAVGDPRLDLGYFAVFADVANFPRIGQPAAMPTEAELVARYAEVSGVPQPDARWFAASGRLKMAAIMSHNLARHRQGRHEDATQETLPPTIDALIANATTLLADVPDGASQEER